MVYLQSVRGRSHLLLQLPPLYRRWRPAAATHRSGFSVDQRQIVSGGGIGLYLALPQESGGTTLHDTSGPDATGLIPAHRMTGSLVSAAQSAKSINRTGGYPRPAPCTPSRRRASPPRTQGRSPVR